MEDKPIDFIGGILLLTLFLLLAYAGFLSYQSIDWNVLKRLESTPLALPAPATSSATPASPSASPNP
ncbi:MAG: hypothetical protein WCV93_02980 [Candidatus Shapirobacteria bacterium]|jgi:hypothetical protein